MAPQRPTHRSTYNWLHLFLPFAVGYYLSYLLRNVNAVLAPELTRELSLTAADLGLLTSAYFFAFGAFQLPLGILLDRYGARRVEAVLLLFASAGTLLFSLGDNIGTLAVGRALIGFGVSACLMAALKNFSQWYPAERQSSLTGAIMTAGVLGAITASVPLEALLPLMGWRGVFLTLTAIILVAAALVFFVVPDHHDHDTASSFVEQWRGVVDIFANRHFWRYAPIMTLFPGAFMAISGLWIVPWFMNVEHMSREAAAQNLMIMGITQLVSFFVIAAFATPLIRRGMQPSRLIGVALAVAWTCLVLIVAGITPSLPLWVVYSFSSATATLMYAALGRHFAPKLYGRVTTTLNLMSFVGAFLLQWGIGWIVDLASAAQWTTANAFRAALAVTTALQLLTWIWFAVEGRRHMALRRRTVEPIPPAP